MSHSTTQNPRPPVDDGDDWEVITPPAEAPSRSTAPTRPQRNPYLDFQMSTRFGQLSFTINPGGTGNTRPTTRTGTGIATETRPDTSLQGQSPLFNKLPTEIRLYIYELVLHIPTNNHAVRITNDPDTPRKSSILSILQTCQLINSEAETLFYTLNRLMPLKPAFWASLHQNHRRRNAITKLAIPATHPGAAHMALEALTAAPNLKSLYLIREQSARFADIPSWRMMLRQCETAIGNLEKLEELKVITPEVRDPTAPDLVRMGQLKEVDRRLIAAVGRSRGA